MHRSSGSIGAAVARGFAAEGARVFLAGRTKPSLEAVAEQIKAASGKASATVIDALADTGVNRYLDVAKQAGSIDILVDLTGPLASDYGNGKVAVELPVDEFMAALTTIVRFHFITARAAERRVTSRPQVQRRTSGGNNDGRRPRNRRRELISAV